MEAFVVEPGNVLDDRELDRLSPLRRGQRREQLRGDIARCRAAIRIADERLTELAGQVPSVRRAPSRPQTLERSAPELSAAPDLLVHELDPGTVDF